jgi:hypothetical protein
MNGPPPADAARVAAALRVKPVTWRAASRGGQTAAARWLVSLPDGTTAFVKIGATLDTAAWVRDEHLVYARLRGRAFLPRVVGWHDDGDRPVLALEDLSTERWPPPWDTAAIDAVLACLDELHATTPPPDMPSFDRHGIEFHGVWQRIGADPAPLLSLGLCDAAWLERALPDLAAAADAAVLAGDALLHMDVRSDNLCLRGGRAVLVDWNWACVGSPAFDLAWWLPSLHAEGGPPPEAVLSEGATEHAALAAGYFCAHAGLPPIPEAPHVRDLQLRQARTALPWAARVLGLPPP